MPRKVLDPTAQAKLDLSYLTELQTLQADLTNAVQSFDLAGGAELAAVHPIIRKGVTASIRDIRKIAKRLYEYSGIDTGFTLQDIQLFKLVAKSTSKTLDTNIAYSALVRATDSAVATAIQSVVVERSSGGVDDVLVRGVEVLAGTEND